MMSGVAQSTRYFKESSVFRCMLRTFFNHVRIANHRGFGEIMVIHMTETLSSSCNQTINQYVFYMADYLYSSTLMSRAIQQGRGMVVCCTFNGN